MGKARVFPIPIPLKEVGNGKIAKMNDAIEIVLIQRQCEQLGAFIDR